MENRFLASTLSLVQVDPAGRAKPPTILFTKKLRRQGHDNFLLDIWPQINLLAGEGDQAQFFAPDFQFLGNGIVMLGQFTVTKQYCYFQVTGNRFQAASAR